MTAAQQRMTLIEAGQTTVFFDDPGDDTLQGMTWPMSRELWEQLGQPDAVTVTVEAG